MEIEDGRRARRPRSQGRALARIANSRILFILSFFSVLSLFSLLSCAPAVRAPLSPGETPIQSIPLELREGLAIEFNRVTAVVLNRKGQVLCSFYRRVPGQTVNPRAGTIEGGHALFDEVSLEAALDVATSGVEASRLWVYEQCVQKVQHLSGAAFALNWTIPSARRVSAESPWQAISRAIPHQTGAPVESLKREYVFQSPQTGEVYMRLRYTGRPDDRFLIQDPARDRGDAYHSESLWIKPTDPPAMFLIALMQERDGLDGKTIKRLFGL